MTGDFTFGFSTEFDVTVRHERAADLDAIREVNDRAFEGTLEGRIVDALRPSGELISLVATVADRVVGHIAFSPVTVEPSSPTVRFAGLAPMAVLPEFQRHGIGGQLVRAGLDACRRSGYGAIVVVGHPDYYPRFGFVPAHTRGLKYEAPVPDDVFMVLELVPGAIAGPPGVVRYRPEFSITE